MLVDGGWVYPRCLTTPHRILAMPNSLRGVEGIVLVDGFYILSCSFVCFEWNGLPLGYKRVFESQRMFDIMLLLQKMVLFYHGVFGVRALR